METCLVVIESEHDSRLSTRAYIERKEFLHNRYTQQVLSAACPKRLEICLSFS